MNLKKCFAKDRNIYEGKVRVFLEANRKNLVGALKELMLDEKIHYTTIKNKVDTIPLASWVDAEDECAQMVCLLKTIGFKVRALKDGCLEFDQSTIYPSIVSNYLKMSGKDFLAKLAYQCERTSGRISYEAMSLMLSELHFPKPPYAAKVDEKTAMLIFLNNAGLYYVAYEGYIFLP